jgi:hypothetical protein
MLNHSVTTARYRVKPLVQRTHDGRYQGVAIVGSISNDDEAPLRYTVPNSSRDYDSAFLEAQSLVRDLLMRLI